MDFEKLTQIAILAALDAGKIIQDSINKEITVEEKEGGNTRVSQVVTEVDKNAEKAILEHLLPTCKTFNLGLLTEETEDDKSRFEKDFFWCIDPLDGTLAFIDKKPGFSVSIALISKDGIPKIGVIYNPSTKTLYHAIQNKGAFRNSKPWVLNTFKNYLTYVTDKKLSETPNKEQIKAFLNNKLTSLQLKEYKEISGSGAVMNAILVAENLPAIFLKLPKKEIGGGSIWDYAATSCIFNELNLQATTFINEQLDLNNKESTFMNHKGIYYSSLQPKIKH